MADRVSISDERPEETARIDSEGIEHHVSEETLRAMARFLARKVM